MTRGRLHTIDITALASGINALPAKGASSTAIVRGVCDTIGIAVAEVYALK